MTDPNFQAGNIVALYVLMENLYWVSEQHSDDHYQLFTKKEIDKKYGISHKKGTLLCWINDPEKNYDIDCLYGFNADKKQPNDDVCLGIEWLFKQDLVCKVPDIVKDKILSANLISFDGNYEDKDTISMRLYDYNELMHVIPIAQNPLKNKKVALVLTTGINCLVCTKTKLKLYPRSDISQ